MTDQNDFQWWEAALDGRRGPVDVNEPMAGFFRVKTRKGGEALPVAFWRKDGELRCRLGGVDVGADRALEIWPWASKNPVSYEDYVARMESGKWPGESEAVRNHNQAPPADSVEAIAERIADLAREAEKMIAAGAAVTEAICDQASDLASTFGEIENKVKNQHRAEKEQHLEAGRACDRKWFALRDIAADLKRRLKLAVVTPFLAKKEDATRAANVAAVQAGTAPDALPQTRLTAGSSKRSTALRTQVSAEITDWNALLAALHAHPEIRDTAQCIANASAKAGVALPGMTIKRERVAA